MSAFSISGSSALTADLLPSQHDVGAMDACNPWSPVKRIVKHWEAEKEHHSRRALEIDEQINKIVELAGQSDAMFGEVMLAVGIGEDELETAQLKANNAALQVLYWKDIREKQWCIAGICNIL